MNGDGMSLSRTNSTSAEDLPSMRFVFEKTPTPRRRSRKYFEDSLGLENLIALGDAAGDLGGMGSTSGGGGGGMMVMDADGRISPPNIPFQQQQHLQLPSYPGSSKELPSSSSAMREEDREAVNLLLTLSGEGSPNTTATSTTNTTTSSAPEPPSQLNRLKRRRGDVSLTVDTKVGFFDPFKAHGVPSVFASSRAFPSVAGDMHRYADGSVYRMDGEGYIAAAGGKADAAGPETRGRTLSCLAELATIEFDRACSPLGTQTGANVRAVDATPTSPSTMPLLSMSGVQVEAC
jgi:hypothetical protein